MEDWLGEILTFFVQLLLVAGVVLLALIVLARAKGGGSVPREQLRIEDLGQRQRQWRERLIHARTGTEKRSRLRWPWRRDTKPRQDEGVASSATTWVIDFHGNLKASGVDRLAREVSLLLGVAKEGDEVVIRLESPGGLVHTYRQGAAELHRLTEGGLKTTVCVDKVAASGGYLMACNAQRILVAPFAVIGSIGVVAQIPNVHRLLKRHDVDVELVTAGRYKRTLTVLGENTEEGRDKLQADLDAIHAKFKDYVDQRRSGVDIDAVSTGEVWYGEEAVSRGLADEVTTSEAYLSKAMERGKVLSLRLAAVPSLAERLGFSASGMIEQALNRVEERVDASGWEHR